MAPRILMVMPSVPWPESGAEQSDRAQGIAQLKRLGFDVRIIAKVLPDKVSGVEAAERAFGAPLTTVPYRAASPILPRLAHPAYLDGAAYEFADPLLQKAVAEAFDSFKPQALWCEYTFLWPVHHFARNANIPIFVRSHNFEPEHFLQEDGTTLLNRLRALPKYMSERRSAQADLLFSISPFEAQRYRVLGARAEVLPLRGLHRYLDIPRRDPEGTALHVVFSGSTYSVPHNLAAAKMLIERIAPEAERLYPGAFAFHITGGKLPGTLQLPPNVTYHGYVENLDELYSRMHIALTPSVFGAGMQQKIFEPLCRGLAAVTSRRGLAGYGFEEGAHVLLADRPEEFVAALHRLQEQGFRRKLAAAGRERAGELFSREALDATVSQSLRPLL